MTSGLRVPFLLLMCSVVLVAGCSGRKSDQFRREADTLFILGKFDEAAGAYARAEEVNPENAMAKVGRGRCFLIDGQADEALKKFRGAIEIDPTLRPAYEEAVRALLGGGDSGAALALADEYVESDPQAGGVFQARVLRQLGRNEEAIERMVGLREQFPDSEDIRIDLAAAYLSTGRAAEAETELERLATELGTESVVARILLVEAFHLQGKEEEAVAGLEKLSEADPGDIGIRVGLVQGLLAAGRVPEAVETARALYEQHPDSGWANYAIGQCLLEQRSPGEALPRLERATVLLPGNVMVASALAKARGAGDGTRRPVPSVSSTSRPGLSPRTGTDPRDLTWQALWKQAALRDLLDNRARFSSKDDPELAETLTLAALFVGDTALTNELREALPAASPIHAYLKSLEAGQPKEFIELMESWTETDEERVVLRENAYGVGLSLMGVRSLAVTTLVTCSVEAPEYGVSFYNLARVFRAAAAPRVAAYYLKMLTSVAVNNLEAHSLLCATLRQAGALEEAQQAAEVLYSLFPDAPEASLNLAQAYLDTGNVALAKSVLDGGIQRSPENAPLLLGLAQIELKAKKPEEALAYLSRLPSEPEAGLKQAVTASFAEAASNNWTEAAQLLDRYRDEPMPANVRMLKAAALIGLGDTTGARALFDDRTGTRSQLPGQRIVVEALDRSDAKLDEDSEALVNALATDSAQLAGHAYGLACLATRYDGLAHDQFETIHGQIGGNSLLAELMLRCMLRTVPEETREEEARAMVGQHAAAPRVWLALAEVLHSLEDVDGQRAALEEAVEIGPENPQALRALAGFSEQRNEFKAAINSYRRLVVLTPRDPAANNNLSYCILMANGSVDEAVSHAEAALKERPGDARILHTLGLAYFQKGDQEASEKHLKLALTLRPGDPTLLLDFGRLLIDRDQTEEGLRHVRLALVYADRVGLEFSRSAEANQILADHPASTPATES